MITTDPTATHSPTITDVPGVEVGHWSEPAARTGCTAIVFPPGNTGAGEIRGAYPAAREFATLACGMNTGPVDAVLFTGGSSFGLAAASGLMEPLEQARCEQLGTTSYLPVVTAAVIYDLAVGDPRARPGEAEGRAAYDARSSGPVERGAVGAGTGATVAKWRGRAATQPGGIGTWSVRAGEATVGVLVVVNAVGDVFTLEGEALTGGPAAPQLRPDATFGARENTTLAVLATDGRASRTQLQRALVRMHDAFGADLRPAHTRWDGDAAVAVSCGQIPIDLDELGEAAFVATARAIESVFAPGTTIA